jgi:hypothetical protein
MLQIRTGKNFLAETQSRAAELERRLGYLHPAIAQARGVRREKLKNKLVF